MDIKPPPFPIPPNTTTLHQVDGRWRFGVLQPNPCWVEIDNVAWRDHITKIAADNWEAEAKLHPGTDYEDVCKNNADACRFYARAE